VVGSAEAKRALIDPDHEQLSVTRQCELLGLARSSWYYEPRAVSAENLTLLRLLDEQYTRCPFYGVRRMTAWLRQQGYRVNPKRVARLMRVFGIAAIYPKPHLSVPGDGHEIYPYLLRDVVVERRDQVWSTDITYIRLAQGFVYLVAVLDWFSRYVLAWELSVNDGCRLLSRCVGASPPERRPAGDLQQRSGSPVHEP
jgi:putative transposase